MPLTTSSFDHAGAYWAAPSPAKRRTASPARFSSPAQTPSADAHSPAALRPVKKTPVKNTPVKKEIKPLFLGLLVLAMGGAGASVLLVVRESPDFLPLEARAAAAIGLCSVGVWLLSIPLVDVSIVDIWWPVAFVVQALAVSEGSALEPRQRICLALICIWALRLAGFLIYRKVLEGGKEDTRYADYVLLCKRGMHPNWQVVLASLLNPFLVQALMQLLVGSPVVFVFGRSTAHPLGTLDLVAALLWCAGFVFEAGSDLQLAIFKADGANRGKVLATGFFKHTRHPNYFGDSVIFLAYGLFAIAHDRLACRLLGSPVMMYVLLRYVSGAELLDKEMALRKPQYKVYIASVSPFFPWPRQKHR